MEPEVEYRDIWNHYESWETHERIKWPHGFGVNPCVAGDCSFLYSQKEQPYTKDSRISGQLTAAELLHSTPFPSVSQRWRYGPVLGGTTVKILLLWLCRDESFLPALRCRHGKPSPNMASAPGLASLGSSCCGQAMGGSLIAVNLCPLSLCEQGSKGSFHTSLFVASSLHCHGSSLAHHSSLVSQWDTQCHLQCRFGTHQGHGVISERHPTGTRLEPQLQKGFHMNESNCLCTVICLSAWAHRVFCNLFLCFPSLLVTTLRSSALHSSLSNVQLYTLG